MVRLGRLRRGRHDHRRHVLPGGKSRAGAAEHLCRVRPGLPRATTRRHDLRSRRRPPGAPSRTVPDHPVHLPGHRDDGPAADLCADRLRRPGAAAGMPARAVDGCRRRVRQRHQLRLRAQSDQPAGPQRGDPDRDHVRRNHGGFGAGAAAVERDDAGGVPQLRLADPVPHRSAPRRVRRVPAVPGGGEPRVRTAPLRTGGSPAGRDAAAGRVPLALGHDGLLRRLHRQLRADQHDGHLI